MVRNRRLAPEDIRAEIRLVKLQMAGDLVVLTVLLNLTGGIENPFFFLYVIHVIIASLLFKGREIYQIAWLAIALFTIEVLCEYTGVLPHHHLLSASEMTHELPFVLATLASFWLVMLFSAYMGATHHGPQPGHQGRAGGAPEGTGGGGQGQDRLLPLRHPRGEESGQHGPERGGNGPGAGRGEDGAAGGGHAGARGAAAWNRPPRWSRTWPI